MKKKILIAVISLVCVFVCTFGFTGCKDKKGDEQGEHTHNFIEKSIQDEYVKSVATCKNKAVYYYSCACGEKGTETFEHGELGGHTVVTDSAVPATCTETGLTEGSHCSACNTVFTAQEVVSALGHAIQHHDAEAATCTAVGWDAYDACSRCEHTTKVEIPKLGHNYSAEWTIDVEATTETAGSKSHHCTRCGDKTDVTEIPRIVITEFNVIFNANGGKVDGKDTKTIVGTINETIDRPNDPTRTDYKFTGWYKDGATTELWDFDTDTIKGATTLYAGWEIDIAEYDVTYVHNYAGSTNVTKSTENGLITYIPTRSGYLFNGWWFSDGQTADGSYILSEKFDTSKRVRQSGLVLYAEWVQDRTNDLQLYSPSVNISDDGVFNWNAVDNALSYRVEVYSDSSKIAEETLTVTNWTFPNGLAAGYYTVKIRSNGDGERTINSAYTQKYYAHHILASITGFSFNVSTSLLTWSAVKNATSYEVRINNTPEATISYTTYDLSNLDAGDYTVSVTPVREGYRSKAYTRSISKKRLKTPSVTVTENASACNYTISWNAVAHANTYRIKHHDTYITVTDTRYTINNDNPIYDKNGSGKFTVCAYDSNADYFISEESTSFTIEKFYSITLTCSDNSAGSVSSVNKGYKFGESVTISATTKEGYTFVGWYNDTQKLADELSYTFTMPRENVTYTAKWCKVTVISDNASAGTVSSLSSTYKSGDKVTITASTNLGYNFDGWYNGAQKLSGELSYTFTMPSDNVTFTAKFEVHPQLAAFTFTSTQYSLTITGVKNKLSTELIIPNCVTTIQKGAFSGCNNLTSITLPFIGASKDSISYTHFGYIFGASSYSDNKNYVPSGLKTVIITDDTRIKGYAFYNCNSLTSITIPSSVWSIEYDAFYGCSSLASFTIPSGVSSIGDETFYGCSSLASITIPSSVTRIWPYAFFGCRGLTSITFGANSKLASIGDYAFEYCSSLISITIPESVTSIGKYAFYNCSRLTNITIPDSVTSIGNSAFSDCSGLTSIIVDSNNQNYSSQDGILYNKAKTAFIHIPKAICGAVTIPSGITSIGSSVFYSRSNLTSITIPNSVTSIGDYAFEYCSSLIIITIPESVTSIGNSAFGGCRSITSITFAENSKLTSIGSQAFYGCSNLTSITFAENSKLTSIASEAFYGCSGLTSIMIPSSVTSIGESAFRGCDRLQYNEYDNALYLGNTDNKFVVLIKAKNTDITSCIIYSGTKLIYRYAFGDCSSLTSITIPSSVTSIGNSAFGGCSSITSITFAENSKLTSIGNHAFGACSSLTSITIPSGVTSIGEDAFRWCGRLKNVTIPSSVMSIGNGAFEGCSSLTSITIPESVTSIGEDAFYGCSSLSEITFAENSKLKSIGVSAFWGCSSLTSITIPSSVTSIGQGAFSRCSSLTSITFTENSKLTSIGNHAFSDCSSLTSITIPSSVTSIGDGAFSRCSRLTSITVERGNINYHSDGNCLIETASKTLIAGCNNSIIPTNGSVTSIGDYAFSGCSSLTSITIPNSVTSIGFLAFSYCSSLTSITIPNSVTSIKDYAFEYCRSLTSITFAENSKLTSIWRYAFRDCSSLTSITIPNSVTSIGDYAFSGCSSLTSITIPNSVTSIEYRAFYGCSKLTIYCEVASEPSGWSSNWNDSSCPVVWNCKNNDKDASGYAYAVIDGIRYQLKGGIATVCGQPNTISGAITIPSSVMYKGTNYSVTGIGAYAFYECSSLTSITIPSSVTSIGRYAFYYCKLTSIKFNGTIAQWEAISKDYNWIYNTGNYTVTCTDGTL